MVEVIHRSVYNEGPNGIFLEENTGDVVKIGYLKEIFSVHVNFIRMRLGAKDREGFQNAGLCSVRLLKLFHERESVIRTVIFVRVKDDNYSNLPVIVVEDVVTKLVLSSTKGNG